MVSLPRARLREPTAALSLSRVAGGLGAGIGVAVLAGWVVGFDLLRSGLPGLPPAMPIPAACFVLSGIALALWAPEAPYRRRRLATTLASIVAVVGLYVLARYFAAATMGAPPPAQQSGGGFSWDPADMPIATAIGVLAVGGGLWCLWRPARGLQRLAQPFALVAVALGLFCVVGFVLSEPLLPWALSVPLPIGTAFLVVSGGVLLAQRDPGGAILASPGKGGSAARGLVPIAFGVPFALAVIEHQLIQRGTVSAAIAEAGFVAVTVVAWSVVVGILARRLDRADAERALAQTRTAIQASRLRKIVEANLIGIVFTDTSGRVAEANDIFLETMGYTRADLRRGELRWGTFVPPEMWPLLEEHARELGEKGEAGPFEGRFRHKDGHLVPLLVGAVRLEGPHIAAFAFDLTVLRRAEAGLRDSEARYRRIVETSNEGLALLDAELVVGFANGTLSSLLGREELVGAHIRDLVGSQPEEDVVSGFFRRARTSPQRETMCFRRGDGRLAWLRVSARPSPDAQGRGGGVLAMFADETDRHLAEERRRAYTRALERANRDLEAFAVLASHDLQEPLRKVGALAERLEQNEKGLTPEGRDWLARIRAAARRMQLLIDDLLAYSQVSTRACDFSPVDLGRLAEEAIGSLSGSIERFGARIEAGPLPTLDGDREQLRQLLRELFLNAIKYRSPDRPLVVSVLSRPLPGERWEIAVRDNGIGFDDRHRERIFGIFQRLHTTSEFAGTGIGLAICRKIAEAHGGSIDAQGEPGHGSCFRVVLPARKFPDRLPSSP